MTSQDLRLPQPGDIVDGKYRVVRLIGEGGMGAVYAAYHELLRHEVALKILLPAIARDAQAVARFVQEARAVARLKSTHIATVMDIGTLENGSAYISMEYLEGQDLGTMLEARGPLPVAEAVDYVLQALEGLAHAHALGIVHRDIKPANIFVTNPYGGSIVVKVLDFGIAKATRPLPQAGGASVSTGSSTSKSMLGSPGYMSPEQVRSSSNVDARCDVWSIGVTLYRLLLDRPPFDGESLGALFGAILQDTPPSPRTLRPEIAPELDRAIMRCLERKPEARWATVADLAQALAPHAGPEAEMAVARIARTLSEKPGAEGPNPLDGASVRPPAPPRNPRTLAKRQITYRPANEPPPPLPPSALGPVDRQTAAKRRPPWVLAAAAIVFLAGIAIGVFLATR